MFRESITKTLNNFDKHIKTKEDAERVVEFHENQWISQEECWNNKETTKNISLWNRLMSMISNKFPELGGE
jgi:hypothetical protein